MYTYSDTQTDHKTIERLEVERLANSCIKLVMLFNFIN